MRVNVRAQRISGRAARCWMRKRRRRRSCFIGCARAGLSCLYLYLQNAARHPFALSTDALTAYLLSAAAVLFGSVRWRRCGYMSSRHHCLPVARISKKWTYWWTGCDSCLYCGHARTNDPGLFLISISNVLCAVVKGGHAPLCFTPTARRTRQAQAGLMAACPSKYAGRGCLGYGLWAQRKTAVPHSSAQVERRRRLLYHRSWRGRMGPDGLYALLKMAPVMIEPLSADAIVILGIALQR